MTFPEDPIQSFPMGKRIKMWINFTDADGNLADPDVATLIYIDGENVPTTVVHGTLANPSIGRWEHEIVIPQDGNKAAEPWIFRYEGTSTDPAGVNTAEELRFEVEPSPFYPPT